MSYFFCSYRNSSFRDWENIDGVGVDAKAFSLTGHQTIEDSAVDKQIPYLVMHFEKTEKLANDDWSPINPSSCKFRCQWNFANTTNARQWTPLLQAYRYRKNRLEIVPGGVYDTGFEVVTTKNKVRGKGRAFALYFETEPYHDCKILGWNITLTGNSIT